MNIVARNGKLWIDFYHQSKRVRKSLKMDDTKKNRKIAMQEIVPELMFKLRNEGAEFFENTNNEDENVAPLFGEFAKVSFDMHTNTRKSSTLRDYEISLRLHIVPFFGKKRLDKIKASDVAIWQNRLLEKSSPGRVRNIRAVLHTIFEDALRDDLIKKNPVALVKAPPLNRIEPKSLSLEEIKMILEKATGDLKNICAVGAFTGLRSGEILGLQWEDIDFDRKEIEVRRSIRMGVVSTPKTASSIRTVDILEPLLPYLLDQYEMTGGENSFVFLNTEGRHYFDIKYIRDGRWKKLLKECGIPYRPIYQLRHSFATFMIENGEDVLWVSNMLGHADPSMTLTKYAKYQKREKIQRATFLNTMVALVTLWSQ